MADNSVYHPFMLMDGDKPAMDFARGNYETGLADANQYVQGDLVYVTATGYVRKAVGDGGSVPTNLALAGQDYDVPDLELPPNDGSSPHWMFGRGVPLNLIPEKHDFVFSVRGGSGGAAANGTDYDLTAADVNDILEGLQVGLHYDTTEGCYVADLADTTNKAIQLKRIFRRGDGAGDANVLVVATILSDFLRE